MKLNDRDQYVQDLISYVHLLEKVIEQGETFP